MHVCGEAAHFDEAVPADSVLWTGRVEVHPGTEAAVWLEARDGATVAAEFFGRLYRVQEDR